MTIAQLTHLHISIPASGAPLGEVPEECFPRDTPSRGLTDPHCVSFASGVTILSGQPPLEQSPDFQIHDPVCPDITEEDEMDIMNAEPNVPIPVLRPPSRVSAIFMATGGVGPDGDPSLFEFSNELPGWFPWGYRRQSVDPPSLPISPILQNSIDDSVIANVGSAKQESNTQAVIPTQIVGDALPVVMDSGPDVLADSPSLGVACGSCRRSAELFD